MTSKQDAATIQSLYFKNVFILFPRRMFRLVAQCLSGPSSFAYDPFDSPSFDSRWTSRDETVCATVRIIIPFLDSVEGSHIFRKPFLLACRTGKDGEG